MNKCKGCEWYEKPYWSIINPCDNCPRENTNVEIFTRWVDPTIEELKNQLQQKENIIKEVREYINNHLYMESTGGIQHPTFDGKMNRDTNGFEILEILDKGE